MAGKPGKKDKRVLTLTEISEFTRYRKDGEERVIWALKALDAEGNPINADLRTFDEDIPLDEQREFFVQAYVDERHGTSYTVTLVREKLGPRVEGLETWRTELDNWRKDIEMRMKGLEEPDF